VGAQPLWLDLKFGCKEVEEATLKTEEILRPQTIASIWRNGSHDRWRKDLKTR
jgi:hypothetical protein